MKGLSYIAIVVLLVVNAHFATAQNDERPDFQKIKAEKVAFLTSKMNLTVEEAQKFWPIYNEMDEKLDALRKEMHTAFKEFKEKKDNITDADYEKMTDKFIDNELAEAQIKKEYHAKYKKTLPIEKVAKFYRAEKEFNEHLLHELKKRHDKGDELKKEKP